LSCPAGDRRALAAAILNGYNICGYDFFGSAVPVLAIGAVLGLALSIALGRLLGAMLFGVQPLDPMTFASVAMLLILTAAVSIAGPAWRATRIDPVAALRSE
jgi:putative ABC transport system permease protein